MKKEAIDIGVSLVLEKLGARKATQHIKDLLGGNEKQRQQALKLLKDPRVFEHRVGGQQRYNEGGGIMPGAVGRADFGGGGGEGIASPVLIPEGEAARKLFVQGANVLDSKQIKRKEQLLGWEHPNMAKLLRVERNKAGMPVHYNQMLKGIEPDKKNPAHVAAINKARERLTKDMRAQFGYIPLDARAGNAKIMPDGRAVFYDVGLHTPTEIKMDLLKRQNQGLIEDNVLPLNPLYADFDKRALPGINPDLSPRVMTPAVVKQEQLGRGAKLSPDEIALAIREGKQYPKQIEEYLERYFKDNPEARRLSGVALAGEVMQAKIPPGDAARIQRRKNLERAIAENQRYIDQKKAPYGPQHVEAVPKTPDELRKHLLAQREIPESPLPRVDGTHVPTGGKLPGGRPKIDPSYFARLRAHLAPPMARVGGAAGRAVGRVMPPGLAALLR